MTRKHWSRAAGAASCAVAWLLTASHAAATEGQDGAPSNAAAGGGLGNHQKNVRFDIGARTQFVNDAGFDPFSERDALAQLTLAASFAFFTQDRLSLAGVVGFDYGGSSATLRSDQTSLDLSRFSLAPEARYHVLRVLALTARLGPTLTREAAELSGGLDTPLSKTSWKFGFDATAGAAVELWGYADGATRKPRLWLTGEGGYGWTAPNRLVLKPKAAGVAPQRFTSLDLGELSVAGPLFRITLALSFW